MHILYWLILMNTFHNQCMFCFLHDTAYFTISRSASRLIKIWIWWAIYIVENLISELFFLFGTQFFWLIHVLYFLIIWSKWKLKLYWLENWFNFIRSISWYLRTEKTLKKTLTIFVNSINNQFVPSIFLLIFFIVTYIVYNI